MVFLERERERLVPKSKKRSSISIGQPSISTGQSSTTNEDSKETSLFASITLATDVEAIL